MKNSVIVIFCLLFSVIGVHSQNTLTVDNTPGSVAMFKTFAAAYEAAEPGDTILLSGSGTSYGAHDIYKPLHIVGPGYYLDINQIPGLSNQAAIITPRFQHSAQFGDSSGSTLTGVDTGTATVVLVGDNVSDIIFDKVLFGHSVNFKSPVVIRRSYQQSTHWSHRIELEAGSSGSIITNSNISGLTVHPAVMLSVDHCIIRYRLTSGSLVSVSNTIFVNTENSSSPVSASSASYSNCLAIAGNYLPDNNGNINGQFLTGTNAVFEIFGGNNNDRVEFRTGSSAVGAGIGGTDIGSPGGNSPYVPGGVPGRPRLTRLVVPTMATDTSGLIFEVDAQAFSD